jgi:hypothetical protein
MPRKRKTGVLAAKRPKEQCEVCGEEDVKVLHRHHIIERTELETSNDDFNLAILCANCHTKTHTGEIEIIGVFPGTRPPTGRILVYKKDGVCNFPGMEDAEPYYKPKPKAMPINLKDENNEV